MLEAARAANGKTIYSGSGAEIDWQPLVLPQIDPLLSEGLNAFYKRRPPIRLPFAGRDLIFETAWFQDRPEIADAVTLTLALGKERADLAVPQAVIDTLFDQFGSELVRSALSPGHQAMIVEYALSGALEKIETALMAPVSIVSADPDVSPPIGHRTVELALRIGIEGIVDSWCLLRITYNHLLRLGQLLDRLPKSPPAKSHVDFPLDVHLRMAAVDLSLAELKSLAPGDIVLVDHRCREPETALAVMGEYLVAPVKILPSGYQLVDGPKPAKTAGFAWGVSDYPVQRGPFAESALSNVPGAAVLRAAAFRIAADEAGRAGARSGPRFRPGIRGRLSRSCRRRARIGKGEFTTIGTGLGVRIVR
ncbi:MAG: hypothetical protein HC850_06850 [Rhodomicrobium sp.]|nr:hypothetical protein [Rhodomicrobium sp.]